MNLFEFVCFESYVTFILYVYINTKWAKVHKELCVLESIDQI